MSGVSVTTNFDRQQDSLRLHTCENAYPVIMIPAIDINKDRFPYCIVWTPIPIITWFFPFLGHMGICSSNGIVNDFAGPFTVGQDNMAFGRPLKYWQLVPDKVENAQVGWDAAVSEANEMYKKRMHYLFYDNCHSHVAKALNIMKYGGYTKWNMVILAFGMLFHSHYVSYSAIVKTWLPFLIYVAVMAVSIYYLIIREA